jgi:serine/threonine protein kinase
LGGSSLQQTKKLRGTPIFCAPEMLVNPFDVGFDETVAKPSRKTDIYAFALLCWQVLVQKPPFGDLRTEGALCAKVHQGVRPSMNELPTDTPEEVKALMIACWDSDRSKRKSAVECSAVLAMCNSSLNLIASDLILCCDWDSSCNSSDKLVVYEIFHHFSRYGLNVCLCDIVTNPPTDKNLPIMVLLTDELCGNSTKLSQICSHVSTFENQNVFYVELAKGVGNFIPNLNGNVVKSNIIDASEIPRCLLPDDVVISSNLNDISTVVNADPQKTVALIQTVFARLVGLCLEFKMK